MRRDAQVGLCRANEREHRDVRGCKKAQRDHGPTGPARVREDDPESRE